MLSRIANNLYWAGRNLERIEHIARYVPVNYFSSLDGPKELQKQEMLRSLNTMAGSLNPDGHLEEKEVLFNIAFEESNPFSIVSCVGILRLNCRGAQDLISSELWESVNSLYLFIHDFDQKKYLETSMNEFMIGVSTQVTICKARVDQTLIKNQIWSTLKLGLLLERCFQINRIIGMKMINIERFETQEDEILLQYEIITLLKSLESYDMSRKFYKKPVNKELALEFLIFNPLFPRSLTYCIKKICDYLQHLSLDEKGKENSVRRIAENLHNELKFEKMEDIASEPLAFLEMIQQNIIEMHSILNDKYFS